MKDACELLREKETAILRLRQEIEALRCVIPLLLDDPRFFLHRAATGLILHLPVAITETVSLRLAFSFQSVNTQ